jgi:ubiquinone/menaquinone biosynthesis C-methylase UbiE
MNRTLNIGSGRKNMDVCDINLDISLECQPTVCGNAEKLPFKDNTFFDVKAYHVLEHIPNIVETMNECWRVLVDGGMLRTCVPMFPSVGSIADPTHIRYFIPETFEYFTEKGKLPGLKHTFKQERVGLSKDKAQLFVDMGKRE